MMTEPVFATPPLEAVLAVALVLWAVALVVVVGQWIRRSRSPRN